MLSLSNTASNALEPPTAVHALEHAIEPPPPAVHALEPSLTVHALEHAVEPPPSVVHALELPAVFHALELPPAAVPALEHFIEPLPALYASYTLSDTMYAALTTTDSTSPTADEDTSNCSCCL